MAIQLVNALYLIVAIAMVSLILMQRGTGAAAGSGFGGGASATVFGSRGASNFLSKSTKWLAMVFFALSLGMAVYASRSNRGPEQVDLGVMGAAPAQSPPPGEIPAGELPPAGPAAEDIPQAAPPGDPAAGAVIDTPEPPVEPDANGG